MAFIFKVQTVGINDTFTLPLIASGTYDAIVNWGDGSADSVITTYDDADRIHTYAIEDLYTITITGTLYGWRFNNGGDCTMMRDVSDWGAGVFRMGSTDAHFYGCTGLTSSAGNAPDITGTISLQNSFRGCSALVNLDCSAWNMANIISVYATWYGCASLVSLGDLSGWNVENTTIFSYMVFACTSLISLGSLSSWNVAKAEQFNSSWAYCSLLTSLGDLSDWNVANVVNFTNAWLSANSALTDYNYSKMLIAWSKLPLSVVANAHFGNAKYYIGEPTDARAVIDAVWGTITDGGQSTEIYSASSSSLSSWSSVSSNSSDSLSSESSPSSQSSISSPSSQSSETISSLSSESSRSSHLSLSESSESSISLILKELIPTYTFEHNNIEKIFEHDEV